MPPPFWPPGRDSFIVSYDVLSAPKLKLAVQGGQLDPAGELFDDIAAAQLRARRQPG